MTALLNFLSFIGCVWLTAILYNRAVNGPYGNRPAVYLAAAFAITLGVAVAVLFPEARP